MTFFGFLIIKRSTIFITRAGAAKHKIKIQWPNPRWPFFDKRYPARVARSGGMLLNFILVSVQVLD